MTQRSGAFERNGRGIRSRGAAENLKGCFCGRCDRWRRASAACYSELLPLPVPSSGDRRLAFSHFCPFPDGRLEEHRRRSVDRRGYKSGEAASRLDFLSLPIPRWKSRYPQLTLGRGWFRHGTKVVIGSLIMINPTLIRTPTPSTPHTHVHAQFLCLFAAGRSGQRALPPAMEASCGCVRVQYLIKVQACFVF